MSEYLYIRLRIPEDYADVDPELVLEDAAVNQAFEPEIVSLPQADEQPQLSDEEILACNQAGLCDIIAAPDEELIAFARAVLAARPVPPKLWLWKNFVGGRPEYWAFDNPYPCVSVGGDPLTLGEPCGYALVKESVNGRPNRSEEEAYRAMVRAAAPSLPATSDAARVLAEFAKTAPGRLPQRVQDAIAAVLSAPTVTDEQLSAAFELATGGPNPFYRCRDCRAVIPGVREELVRHATACGVGGPDGC